VLTGRLAERMKHKSVTSVAQPARHHTHQQTPPHFSANLEESHREGTAAKLASSTNRQQASHFTLPREWRRNRGRQTSLPQAGFEPRGHKDLHSICLTNIYLTSNLNSKHVSDYSTPCNSGSFPGSTDAACG